jgi:uncharacterized Zn finger protein
MAYLAWKPYVPVAKRRKNAALRVQELAKKGNTVSPVIIEGRTIAKTFWGRSWCENLERYSDYGNRLPRGRTYVRNGSVVDLEIARGEIVARVSGTDVYTVRINIAPVPPAAWKSLRKDCADSIDSVVELLQGRVSKGVMERVCQPGKGLFPAPKEIKLSCSCPDWADMCKHVAAALYGVGARLDASPELLFTLRGVDHTEMVARAGEVGGLAKKPASAKRILAGGDLGAIFGLDMAEPGSSESAARRKPPAKTKRAAVAPASGSASSQRKGKNKEASTEEASDTVKRTSPRKAATRRAAVPPAQAQPRKGPIKTATKSGTANRTARKTAAELIAASLSALKKATDGKVRSTGGKARKGAIKTSAWTK